MTARRPPEEPHAVKDGERWFPQKTGSEDAKGERKGGW